MKYYPLIFLVTLFFSCQSNEKSSNSNSKNIQQEKTIEKGKSDKITLKPITLELDFTQALQDKLISSGEVVNLMVIVSTNYEWSEDEKIEFKDLLSEKEEMILSSTTIETSMKQNVIVDNIVLDKKLYEKLGEEKLQIEINIFSGRKVFENNIMSCDYVNEKYTDLLKKPFVIKGDLL